MKHAHHDYHWIRNHVERKDIAVSHMRILPIFLRKLSPLM